MLYGTPLDERESGREYPLTGFRSAHVTEGATGLLLTTTLFDDMGAPAYVALDRPGEIEPVALEGLVHEGAGELERLQHLEDDRYAAVFNIDGCSWAYDTHFDEAGKRLVVEHVLVGEGELATPTGVALLTTRGLGGFYQEAGLVPLDDPLFAERVAALQVGTFHEIFVVTAIVCFATILPALLLGRRTPESDSGARDGLVH